MRFLVSKNDIFIDYKGFFVSKRSLIPLAYFVQNRSGEILYFWRKSLAEPFEKNTNISMI